MFGQAFTRIVRIKGLATTTAAKIFEPPDGETWVVRSVTSAGNIQLHGGLIQWLPGLGAVCGPFIGISGTVRLENPIVVNSSLGLTISAVGTSGHYIVTLGKVELR